jgi:hypothetical protein
LASNPTAGRKIESPGDVKEGNVLKTFVEKYEIEKGPFKAVCISAM